MTQQPMRIDASVLGMTGSGFVPLAATHNIVAGLMLTPVYMQLDQPAQAAALPPVRRGLSAEQRATRIGASATRSEGIRRGRARLAASLCNQNAGKEFLVTLRLAAGLSQAELGQRIDMQQPNVARMEKQPGDLGMTIVSKLASALSTSTDRIIKAAENTNLALAQ